jgi:hypothetical protein
MIMTCHPQRRLSTALVAQPLRGRWGVAQAESFIPTSPNHSTDHHSPLKSIQHHHSFWLVASCAAILVVLVLKYRYLSHCAFFCTVPPVALSYPYSTLLPWRLARIKSSTVARPTTRSMVTTLLSLPLSCLPVLQLQESYASPSARQVIARSSRS